MSGASVGCSQPAPCPGMTPLRRCRNRGEKKNIVFIDVDNDNIIFIDVPESLERTYPASDVLRKDRKHKSPRTGVICLDDDEDADHNFDNGGVKNGSNFNDGASSSRRVHTKSGSSGKSSENIADECEFIRENVRPVKLSKCKRTYSGKTSARNRYGLSTDSESCPSDSDYADCELMEDSFGIRELWEKASSRRKCDTRNGQSGVGDPDLNSNDASQSFDGVYDCGQPKEHLFEGTYGEGKETPAHSVSKENGNVDSNYNGKQTCNVADGFSLGSILKRHIPHDKDDSLYRMNPFTKARSWDYSKHTKGQQYEQGGTSACREEQGPKVPASFTCQEEDTCQVNHMHKDFQGRQASPPGEACLSAKDSVGTRSSSGGREKVYPETTSGFNWHCQWKRYQKFYTDKQKFASEQTSSLRFGSSSKDIDNDSSPTNGKDELVRGSTSCCNSSLSPDDFRNGHKIPLVSSSSTDDLQTGQAVKSMGDNQKKDRKVAEALPVDCILSEREKLKETEEYKRAIEEEMASRQRTLQIQAEEAQRLRRLRKRQKAESLRLLDMERRQKQRVEEIRETQKKDEENMNLKEVIRAEVIKELHQIEVRCHDMASLLRGLGTFVSNSVNPSQNEVRSAYKRALLTFHPDRTSRSDIRQQVEAEEKFKLISRMKENFLPI